MFARRLPRSIGLACALCAHCVPLSQPDQEGADSSRVGYGDEMRFDGLARLITTHRVRSVDALLPLLPEELRSRYVLVYESRSVQGASYSAPRVVLFTRDARFVLTFNGDESLTGYLAVETMEFDDRQRAFRFREIAFPNQDHPEAAVRFSESNPSLCLACHGDNPRPIWDSYPTWPGVYGEQEHTRPAADETAGRAAFLAGTKRSERYRALRGVESRVMGAPNESASGYSGKDLLSSNAEFGLLLQGLTYHAIAREVLTSPRFPAFRYALLASLDPQCLAPDDFVPVPVRARFSRTLGDFELETLRANAAQADAKRRRAHTREPPPAVAFETLTPFRYLVEEGLGLSTGGWTLAFERSTYDFTSPHPVTRILERDVLEAVSRSDPSLEQLRGGEDRRDGYCALLRRRSLAALSLAASEQGWRGGAVKAAKVGLPP